MDSLKIKKYLQKLSVTRRYFIGVCSEDEINKYLKEFKSMKKSFIIVNTLRSTDRKGEIGHWLFLGHFNNKIIFVDTFGRSINQSIKNKVSKINK